MRKRRISQPGIPSMGDVCSSSRVTSALMAVIFPHSASHPATTEWKGREEPSCAGWLNTVSYIGASYSAAMTVYAGFRELSRTIHKKQRLWKWGRKDDYSAKA